MDKLLKHKPSNSSPNPGSTRPMCGCGLSLTFPFCDGTQMIAKGHRAAELVSCGAAPRALPALAKVS